MAMLSGCAAHEELARTREIDFSGNKVPGEKTYYYAQTTSVVSACMPPRLLVVLAHIKKATGVTPVLTSALRRNGRSHSMHRHCLAADIRVPGFSDTQVVRIARTAPGIGGIGRYCNGIVHVDVGDRREWTHCARKRSRRA
jgi:uncharacterized protein YcbK (DUF882 family)